MSRQQSRQNVGGDESPSDADGVLPKTPKFMFGLQGTWLRRNISVAGALGFLLFGYDQGFLSVRYKVPGLSRTNRPRV